MYQVLTILLLLLLFSIADLCRKKRRNFFLNFESDKELAGTVVNFIYSLFKYNGISNTVPLNMISNFS